MQRGARAGTQDSGDRVPEAGDGGPGGAELGVRGWGQGWRRGLQEESKDARGGTEAGAEVLMLTALSEAAAQPPERKTSRYGCVRELGA